MMRYIPKIPYWLIVWICLTPLSASPEIIVKDFRGKTLRLDSSPKRVVCLIESALSGLYMLDVQDRVVGISTNVYQSSVFAQYAALDKRIQAKVIPTPGNWDFINVESVVALMPDIVIIWAHQEEAIHSLEEKKIPVFGVFIQSLEDVFREIMEFGKLFGCEDRAAEINDYTKKQISQFSQHTLEIPPENKAKVYFMWAQSDLDTSGKGSTVHELIELAGARNVAEEINQEHVKVNIEKILTWNPDVIVMWYNENKNPSDVMAQPLWRTVKAVKTGRVFELPSVFDCDLWTLKFQYVVKLLATWCYPERFGSINIEAEKVAMFNMLYGKGNIKP